MLSLAMIGSGLTRFGGKALLLGQKYAPQIMTYTGVAGFIGTVVCACKATTKAEKILESKEQQLAEAETEEEEKAINSEARKELIKTYAPVVTLGVASTALILGGHHIIQTRSAGYAAAFKASEKAFRSYREAVAKKYGEDPNKLTISDTSNYKEESEKQKKAVAVAKDNKQPFRDSADVYTAWWAQDTTNEWSPSPKMNYYFLRKMQDQLNDLLRNRGYVFLNDARKKLGLPYIKEGQILGWVLRNDNRDGDNYIDFLHLDNPNDSVNALIQLQNVPVLLDFNCDGIIFEEIHGVVM